jgi:hypothetical protein
MVRRRSVTATVETFIDSLIGLDSAGLARAAIARSLAVKLDQAEQSTSGAVAVASAGLARELSATLDALSATQAADDELLRELMSRGTK